MATLGGVSLLSNGLKSYQVRTGKPADMTIQKRDPELRAA